MSPRPRRPHRGSGPALAASGFRSPSWGSSWWWPAPWRFGTILTQVGQQHQVLVLSHPVDAGDVITASDLGLATVSTGTSGIAFITASNESTVIGRPAAVAMPAGAPLIAADLGSLPPPAGQAVVAVLIKPGDAPPSLAPGAAVWVVITTPETQSTGALPLGDSRSAQRRLRPR